MTPIARARALARAGLVGHPSDGYGGATLAVTLGNFAAEVEATPAEELHIAPNGDGQWPEGGQPLVAATVRRFERLTRTPQNVAIRYRSTIPREVGLGGSSAIVIATLRALAELAATPLEKTQLPELALSVETDDLGIAAGLQDRVVQTYEGLVFMDFADDRHEPLDPALLPELFVAWLPSGGSQSGTAHAGVRARFERGERAVTDAMHALAELAHEALAALKTHDHEAFGTAIDDGYDVRASIFDLDPRHAALIASARELNVCATYTGSGGAIVGIVPDDNERMDELERRLIKSGARVELARTRSAPGPGA